MAIAGETKTKEAGEPSPGSTNPSISSASDGRCAGKGILLLFIQIFLRKFHIECFG